MHFDTTVFIAGAVVGFAVGLTGMGGGALMTPMLVLILGVSPAAAVSSDLIASLVMKPVAGIVHLRRRTAELGIVRWLVVGSVPAAFLGAAIITNVGSGDQVQRDIRLALGVALLVAVLGIALRSLVDRLSAQPAAAADEPVGPVRPLPTLALGAFGGLIVGMTSVGSGSLMIAVLMFLYPRLTGARLVGTDIIQSIPLVAAAALGQALFGELSLGLTVSLIAGSVPAAYLGARVSVRARPEVIRFAVTGLILMSSLKLLGTPTVAVVVVAAVGVVGAGVARVLRSRRPERVIVLPDQPRVIDLVEAESSALADAQGAQSS